METFVSPTHRTSITEIKIKAGETQVVALKLPHISGSPALSLIPYGDDVLRNIEVFCDDDDVAFSRQVIKLAKDKAKYENHYNVSEIDTNYVEQHGLYFFQICGRSAGAANLKAFVDNSEYAQPVRVTVTENPKHLVFSPAVPFDTIWNNHTYVKGTNIDSPCPLLTSNSCMLRFCAALTDSKVNLHGLNGSKCSGSGASHSWHFTNPYDFINWKGTGFYSWTANPPLQPEPMPGLAAWPFMQDQRGVVIFMNYHVVNGSTWGGHIDLWHEDRMGNNAKADTPETGQGLSAFLRARKIFFWPVK